MEQRAVFWPDCDNAGRPTVVTNVRESVKAAVVETVMARAVAPVMTQRKVTARTSTSQEREVLISMIKQRVPTSEVMCELTKMIVTSALATWIS